MTGRQLLDASECGSRWNCHPKRENLIECDQVYDCLNIGTGQQRLDLGGKKQAVSRLSVVERADAETIAREEQLVLWCIPDGEGPLPVEPLDAAFAFFLIEM